MNWDSFFFGIVIGMWLSIAVRDLGEYMRRRK